jgi:hypothetical protein
MDKDLVAEVTRGVIALAVVGGYVYLVAAGQTIPEGYGAIAAAVVGFFFGSGGSAMLARALGAR